MPIKLFEKCTEAEKLYYGQKCDKCQRNHLIDTVLNIEGHIHHHLGFVCLDNKSCRRSQRKLKE